MGMGFDTSLFFLSINTFCKVARKLKTVGIAVFLSLISSPKCSKHSSSNWSEQRTGLLVQNRLCALQSPTVSFSVNQLGIWKNIPKKCSWSIVIIDNVQWKVHALTLYSIKDNKHRKINISKYVAQSVINFIKIVHVFAPMATIVIWYNTYY